MTLNITLAPNAPITIGNGYTFVVNLPTPSSGAFNPTVTSTYALNPQQTLCISVIYCFP